MHKPLSCCQSLALALAYLFLIILIATEAAFALSSKKVFILASYEQNHVCGKPQYDGILNSLQKAGFSKGANLTVVSYYMNTKKTNNTAKLIAEQAQIALTKIRHEKPDLLIVLDDNAIRTVAMELVDTDLPIVFSGMNAQPEMYHNIKPSFESRIAPGHNITGVYEKLHVIDALRVHSKIFPALQKITVITDTSPTGRAITAQFKTELSRHNLNIICELKVAGSWEHYQKIIHQTNLDKQTGVIYPVALLLKDTNNNTFTAPEILTWTAENSTKPELALNFAFVRLGLFGGAAVDFYAMGEQAGTLAAKILKGARPQELPIEEAQRYALAFNLKRAAQLEVTIPNDILLAADEIVKQNHAK